MDVAEALIRRNDEDIVFLGELADNFYKSQQGKLIRAIVNGHICEEATRHKENYQISAERALGRIEAFQMLIDDIEILISQKELALRPKEEEDAEG